MIPNCDLNRILVSFDNISKLILSMPEKFSPECSYLYKYPLSICVDKIQKVLHLNS